jgi:hypothetical protein
MCLYGQEILKMSLAQWRSQKVISGGVWRRDFGEYSV